MFSPGHCCCCCLYCSMLIRYPSYLVYLYCCVHLRRVYCVSKQLILILNLKKKDDDHLKLFVFSSIVFDHDEDDEEEETKRVRIKGSSMQFMPACFGCAHSMLLFTTQFAVNSIRFFCRFFLISGLFCFVRRFFSDGKN